MLPSRLVSLAAAVVILGTLGASPAPASLLVLRDVTVIDATGAPPKSHMVVVVEGGRIRDIRALPGFRAPRGALVVDGRGKYVIPGLWDMHVHLTSEAASPVAEPSEVRGNARYSLPLLVAYGVTGVRDMAGDLELLRAWRDSIDRGLLLGPRMVVTGWKIGGPRAVVPGAAVAFDTPEQVRDAVRRLKASGADFVKIDDLDDSLFPALVDECRRQHMIFVGHVANGLNAAEVSRAGQRSIEHLDDFSLSVSSREAELRERRDKRWSWWMRMQYRLGITTPQQVLVELFDDALSSRSPAREDSLFALLARNRTWQVPTLSLLRDAQKLIEDEAFTEERLAYTPPRQEPPPPTFWGQDTALARRSFVDQMRMTREMYRAGVPIMAGTDIPGADRIPAFSLVEELELLVRAGLPPMAALQSATLEPARYLAATDSMGTVEVGKVADLVVLDANPLENMRNAHRVHAVVLRGRYLSPATLDSLRGSVRSLVRSWSDSLVASAANQGERSR